MCSAMVERIAEAGGPDANLRCVPLASEEGRTTARRAGVIGSCDDTILLVDDDGVHKRSNAALKVAERLTGGYSVTVHARLVPRVLRDAAYRFVARHRHRLSGNPARKHLGTGSDEPL